MQSPKSRGKFVHVSFRIPTELKDQLENEAKRKKMNLNAFVTRILVKYYTFDRLVEHENSVVIERHVFSRILDKMEHEDMAEIGKELGPIIVKQDFEFFGIAPNLDNLVEEYFEPMGTFSDRYEFNVSGIAPNLKLILRHEYSSKWSVFLAEYAKGITNSILGRNPKIQVEDGQVTIEF